MSSVKTQTKWNMSYGSFTAKMLSTFHQKLGLNVLSSYCKDKNVSETHFIIQDSKFVSVWATFNINKWEAILMRLNHNVVNFFITMESDRSQTHSASASVIRMERDSFSVRYEDSAFIYRPTYMNSHWLTLPDVWPPSNIYLN